jgi:hypothetical protein
MFAKNLGFIKAVVVFVSFGIEVAFVGGKEEVITIISVLLIFIRLSLKKIYTSATIEHVYKF